MRKVISILSICAASFLSAQISVAAKANVLIPTDSPSWSNFKHSLGDLNKSTGYNVGLSLKFDTPTSFFVMPELYYTHFKTEGEVGTDTGRVKLEAQSNRLDLPVLLGYKVLGNTLGLYVGPVASINLGSGKTYADYKEEIKNNFTVGYQVGAQAEISKLIFSARYEGAFSKDQRKFVNTVFGDEVRYDSRPSFFLLGLGYKF